MPGDYHFGKRAGACSACGHNFAVGEEYHSALRLEEAAAPPPEPGPEGGAAPPEADAEKPAEDAVAPPLDVGGLPFSRVDLCANCWDAEKAGEFFSTWKSLVPDESEDRRPLARQIDAETIYDMFRRLEGQADPAQQKFRFILALMLMRKKRLRFTGVADSPRGEHLVLEDRNEGITHKVLDPGLGEEEVDAMRVQIGRLLGGGAEAEEEAPAPASAPAPEPQGPGGEE